MKPTRILSFLILIAVSGHSWAYGSGNSQSACKKPEFTHFNPADKSEAAPGAAFSFVVAGIPDPSSINASIKNQSLDITVKELSPKRYAVTGQLPETLKGQFVRINVSAEGKCKGSDGWLVKISD
ncbi:MAG: hypothetical protein Q7U38_16420 [Methylobacter sp.]|nr:hypothetical protein [Methylobacter sp.]MDP2097531.1 hypothetical protein [Methylobacter sp.]MDP2429372.1 hypothetical protein [Methylobacter sp.]MDP3053797.1 hypothetical protein [Methylobacter sp.]MDP3362780.1 hypothetical protein [Methylobacter sp.]